MIVKVIGKLTPVCGVIGGTILDALAVADDRPNGMPWFIALMGTAVIFFSLTVWYRIEEYRDKD